MAIEPCVQSFETLCMLMHGHRSTHKGVVELATVLQEGCCLFPGDDFLRREEQSDEIRR